MIRSIIYLDIDFVIKLNKKAIKLFVHKKSDKHELLSYSKLNKVIEFYENQDGSILDKAVYLLIGITKAHAFASANRRTSVLATSVFCDKNHHKIYIPNNPSNSKVLIGIRENYYKHSELVNWLKNGKIREFKRF